MECAPEADGDRMRSAEGQGKPSRRKATQLGKDPIGEVEFNVLVLFGGNINESRDEVCGSAA